LMGKPDGFWSWVLGALAGVPARCASKNSRPGDSNDGSYGFATGPGCWGSPTRTLAIDRLALGGGADAPVPSGKLELDGVGAGFDGARGYVEQLCGAPARPGWPRKGRPTPASRQEGAKGFGLVVRRVGEKDCKRIEFGGGGQRMARLQVRSSFQTTKPDCREATTRRGAAGRWRRPVYNPRNFLFKLRLFLRRGLAGR